MRLRDFKGPALKTSSVSLIPFYPIPQPYTVIADLIGAPENVENELLEAYTDPIIDFELDKLADALDKDGNKKISYSEWNLVIHMSQP